MLFYFRRIYQFWKHVVLHFIEIDGTTRAAALSYTTLLSSVPLAVMGIGIFTAFPVFEEYSSKIKSFVFSHFVAASADTIQKYLSEFASKAAGLSASSVFFLLIAAVMLIFTMESALNAIWKVKERRHGVTAFLNYWAVLTLIPILSVSGIALTVYLSTLPYIKGATDSIGDAIPFLEVTSFLLTWFAFTALYVTLPNTKVRIRDGVIGALAGTVLFETVKRVFSYYILNFSSYEFIYGALATVPIFLVWIYLCWLIILFGSVVSFVSQTETT